MARTLPGSRNHLMTPLSPARKAAEALFEEGAPAEITGEAETETEDETGA